MNEDVNNEKQELDVNKLMQVRKEKLKELQKEGKNPYLLQEELWQKELWEKLLFVQYKIQQEKFKVM